MDIRGRCSSYHIKSGKVVKNKNFIYCKAFLDTCIFHLDNDYETVRVFEKIFEKIKNDGIEIQKIQLSWFIKKRIEEILKIRSLQYKRLIIDEYLRYKNERTEEEGLGDDNDNVECSECRYMVCYNHLSKFSKKDEIFNPYVCEECFK
jgi:hypothetical protein